MAFFGGANRQRQQRGGPEQSLSEGKGYRGDWSRAQSVVLDGSGNGTVIFDPDNAWQTVTIEYVVVSTDQADNTSPIPAARVYKGEPAQANFEGGTRDGNMDVGIGRIVMGPADEIQIRFTGGIPGSRATARVSGTYLTER